MCSSVITDVTLVLWEGEQYYSHSRSLKSFVDYDPKMRDCWLIAHILENNLFLFCPLPPKILIASLLCREQFLRLFNDELKQNLFATVRIQKITLQLALQSRVVTHAPYKFFQVVWQATLMVSDLSSVLLVFIIASISFFLKGGYIFHSYLKVFFCVACIFHSWLVSLMVNNTDRSLFTHSLCAPARIFIKDFSTADIVNKQKYCGLPRELQEFWDSKENEWNSNTKTVYF